MRHNAAVDVSRPSWVTSKGMGREAEESQTVDKSREEMADRLARYQTGSYVYLFRLGLL